MGQECDSVCGEVAERRQPELGEVAKVEDGAPGVEKSARVSMRKNVAPFGRCVLLIII